MQTLTIDQILPEGVTLLAGRPKSAKAFLALGIALAVAEGEPVFGRLPVAPGNTLYVDLHTRPDDFVGRLRHLRGHFVPGDFAWTHELLPFEHGGLEALLEWRHAARRPRLIVIDTLTGALYGHAQHRPAASLAAAELELLTQLSDFAREAGVAILLVHNTRASTLEQLLPAGPSGLVSTADATWVLWREAEHGLLSVAGRDLGDQQLSLRFDPARLVWRAS